MINVKYDIVDIRNVSYGSFDNQSNANKATLIGMVIGGTIDLEASEPWIPTEFRKQFVDFSYPIFSEPAIAVVARRPTVGLLDVAMRPFKIYTIPTWIGIFALIAILMTLLTIIQHQKEKLHRNTMSNGNKITLWDQIALITGGEASDVFTRRHELVAINILIVLLSVLLCIVKALYECIILAVLIKPVNIAPIADVQELTHAVQSHKITLALEDESYWINEWIKTSDLATFIKLRHAVKDNPVVFTDKLTREQLITEIIDKNLAYFCLEVRTCQSIRLNDRQCATQLIVADKYEMPPTVGTFMHTKHWTHAAQFNAAMLSLSDQIAIIRNKYTVAPRCSDGPNSAPFAPLRVVIAAPLFIVYACGIAIAMGAFAAERWCKNDNNDGTTTSLQDN